MRWDPRFEVPKVIVTLLWVKTRKVPRCPRQRIHDVVPSHGPSSEFFRQRQCRELGSLGALASAASDLGNSEPALEASGLNTGLRYKVCASSLDHNGQERPRRWANKRVSSVKVSWCVQCCCGDQIWKSRISLGGPGWSRPSCAPHGKRLNVESWWLWGAKPAGYSLFDIYVSGVVSASCLGIWRNFHFVANRKNQAGTYSERCPPFRSFRHLQCVHHLMCPPRDRWVLNHVIMSHHVIWNTWSQSGANGCAGVLARRMLRGSNKFSLIPDDSTHCWWLVCISKNGCFRHQPHFLQQASCFLKIMFTVYCLLLCTSTVHSLQIHPDTWYRYRSMSQYDTICRPLG